MGATKWYLLLLSYEFFFQRSQLLVSANLELFDLSGILGLGFLSVGGLNHELPLQRADYVIIVVQLLVEVIVDVTLVLLQQTSRLADTQGGGEKYCLKFKNRGTLACHPVESWSVLDYLDQSIVPVNHFNCEPFIIIMQTTVKDTCTYKMAALFFPTPVCGLYDAAVANSYRYVWIELTSEERIISN